MFVVTGITGQVGGAVAHHLLEQHQPVRAVVRSEVKGEPWAQKGCDIAVADMNDAASLTAAFTGADGVFVVLPPLFDPGEGFPEMRSMLAALKQALLEARPNRIVCLSTVGAQATQPNLLGQLSLMEQVLGGLDIPIAFLRAAWFMENHIWDHDAARSGAIDSFLQPLDRAIPMVATDDLGREAAALLQQCWTGKRVVELSGAEPISPNDVAAAYADLLGHPVDVRALPREGWQQRFVDDGMANPVPRIQMLDGFNGGWLAFEETGTERKTGSTTLRQVLAPIVGRDGQN